MEPRARRTSLIALVLAVALSAEAASEVQGLFRPMPPSPAGLDEFRWSHRPVLLFAPSKRDNLYKQQQQILRADTNGLAERNILVLSDADPRGNAELRNALKVDGFEVILIGKDGGVKLRSKTPVGTQDLFALIDAMPMRLREMRDR